MIINKDKDRTHPTDKASAEFISQVVAESNIVNKLCEICEDTTWDILLDSEHICGGCYTDIYRHPLDQYKEETNNE
tara:strand:+ start:597 stop:824 length:228 start_codon:yes stop_codon:yes gene_type:complete